MFDLGLTLETRKETGHKFHNTFIFQNSVLKNDWVQEKKRNYNLGGFMMIFF